MSSPSCGDKQGGAQRRDTEQLAKLAKLHTEGALSDQEFSALKLQLISQDSPGAQSIGAEQPPKRVPDSTLDSDWYYEERGRQIGPVSEASLRKQFESGNISQDSLVWNRASGPAWQPLRTTTLLIHSGPPALPAGHIHNTLAWVLAIIPAIGAIVEKMIEGANGAPLSPIAVIMTYLIANSLFALIDTRAIEKSGLNTARIHLLGWAIFLVPVYLFKRARLLQQSQACFIVWCVSFLLALMINVTS